MLGNKAPYMTGAMQFTAEVSGQISRSYGSAPFQILISTNLPLGLLPSLDGRGGGALPLS